MSEGVQASEPVRYGVLHRVALILVGSAMALAGIGVAIAFGVLVGTAASDGKLGGGSPVQGVVVVLLVVLLFGAFAAMGVVRVMDGVRGRSRPRLEAVARTETSIARHWYIVNLVGWALITIGAFATSKQPAELLLRPHPFFAPPAWYLFLGFAILPVLVAVHEVGHAAAGWLAGFRFVETRVGWLALRREAGRFRFSWTPPTIQGVLGFHLSIPSGEAPPVMRGALVAIAGPLASIAGALACRAAGRVLDRTTIAEAIVSDLLSVGWWEGAVLGAWNVVPFRLPNGVMSDGALVLLSILPASPARRLDRHFRWNWTQGRRPRDWGISCEEFARAAETAPRQRDALTLAALAVALDTGDEAQVGGILQRVAPGAPSRDPAMRYELELQAAMVEGFRGEAAAARSRLDRVGAHPQYPEYSKLADAVVQIAEGRFSEASASFVAWERMAASSGQEASLKVGNEWAVERLRARFASEGPN